MNENFTKLWNRHSDRKCQSIPKRFFFTIILSLLVFEGFAQATVTGTVRDFAGEVLPGVNVVEKGTTNGVSTDIDGNFQIDVAPEATLVFSYIGFLTQEIPVNNQTELNVELESDVTQLNDVVVVGYGEQRKETLTGSVSNVSGDEIVKSPSANVSNSLAGRLPGL